MQSMSWRKLEENAEGLCNAFDVPDDKRELVKQLLLSRACLVQTLANPTALDKRARNFGRSVARIRTEIEREIVEVEAQLAPFGLV